MTLQGTNTYIYGSDPALVIDPGPADEGHLAAVREAAEARGGLGGVLLTHADSDHADGVGALGGDLIEPADGESAGGLRAIATPGHAREHLCFLTDDGVCFSGDLVLGEGSTIVAPGGGSLVAYMDSLARLQAEEISLMCPGHGPWITDPRAKLAEYVEHRLMRERRLLAALDRGQRSRSALLREVWDDVPEVLRPVAAFAMEAHLEKLAAEGRLPHDLVD
jgi:glyoxylase-like metal-dependent hydrolase (beta-lactamase superfamily II)